MNNKYNQVSKINENHKYKFSTKDSISKTITWTKDMKYVDLGEFKTFFQCFIPVSIDFKESKSKMYTILVSYASLNKKKIKKDTLLKIAEICNNRIKGGKMDNDELLMYVDKAFEDRLTFVPKDNASVRYLKNPIHEFNVTEMKLETIKLRKKSDYNHMIELAKNWDFEKDGSPTQENLGLKLGYSRRTMIRKFKDKEGLSEFFKVWNELKDDYTSKLFKSDVKSKKELKINTSKKDVKIKKQIIKLLKTSKKLNKDFSIKIEHKPKLLRDKFNSFIGNFNMCQLI